MQYQILCNALINGPELRRLLWGRALWSTRRGPVTSHMRAMLTLTLAVTLAVTRKQLMQMCTNLVT